MDMVVLGTKMNDKITGIILKQLDYKESSAIITILSEQTGKISVIARGVKKPTSKNAGRLLPYTKGEFLIDYRNDKTIFNLKNVSSISIYKKMHMNLERSSCAAVIAEVCDAFVMNGEESEGYKEIYGSLEYAYDLLESGKDTVTILALFLASVMNLYGIRPDVDECVHCGSSYVSAISSKDGGFLCESCADKMHVNKSKVEDLKRFRLLVKGGLDHFSMIEKNVLAKPADIRLLIEIIFLHTGIKIRAFSLFERLFLIE